MTTQHAAQQLIATVTMRPELLPVASSVLPSPDLLEGGAAAAWRAILASTVNGRLDSAKFHANLDRTEGVLGYWLDAQQQVLNPMAHDEEMVKGWAGLLLEEGLKRRAAQSLRATLAQLESPTTTLDDIIGEGMQVLGGIRQGGGLSWQDMGILADEAKTLFDAWADGEDAIDGEPTGFYSLDNVIGSLPCGEMIVIAGRPSQAKTQLCLQILANVARRYRAQGLRKRVALASLETKGVRLAQRVASAMAGIPIDRFKKRLATSEERARLKWAIEELRALAPWFYIDDSPAPTTDTLMARGLALQHSIYNGEQWPIGLLAFDYLELAGNRADTEERRVAEISRASKNLARVLNCPYMVLSQLSREVEANNPPIPALKHLRYSGAVEADAYIVLACYRPGYYYERGMTNLKEYDRNADPNGELAYISVLKNKDGEAGWLVPMRFKTGMWSDPGDPYADYEE